MSDIITNLRLEGGVAPLTKRLKPILTSHRDFLFFNFCSNLDNLATPRADY